MHPRRRRKLRHRGRLAIWFLAAAPLPAFAADAAVSAWVAYLFFSIVATVVIVLLLHEALDDEPMDPRLRDERAGEPLGSGRRLQARHGANDASRDARKRRVA